MKLNIAFFAFFVVSSALASSTTMDEQADKRANLRGLSDATGEVVTAWKRKNGQPCSSDENCFSGICESSCPRFPERATCRAPSSLGGPCVNDSWCDPQYVCDTSTLRSTSGCYYQFGSCKLP